MSEAGRKDDSGKLRYDLVDPFALAWMVAVLVYGCAKYAEQNWRKVEQSRDRYYSSLLRHMEAWRSGEENDPESGFPHLACAMCSLMFLTALHAPRDMAEITRRTKMAIENWREMQKRGRD